MAASGVCVDCRRCFRRSTSPCTAGASSRWQRLRLMNDKSSDRSGCAFAKDEYDAFAPCIIRLPLRSSASRRCLRARFNSNLMVLSYASSLNSIPSALHHLRRRLFSAQLFLFSFRLVGSAALAATKDGEAGEKECILSTRSLHAFDQPGAAGDRRETGNAVAAHRGAPANESDEKIKFAASGERASASSRCLFSSVSFSCRRRPLAPDPLPQLRWRRAAIRFQHVRCTHSHDRLENNAP